MQPGCLNAVNDPKHTMHCNSLGLSYRPQCAVTGKQRPTPAVRQCESKCIGDGQPPLGPPELGSTSHLAGIKRLDHHTKASQSASEVRVQLSSK